MAMFGLPVSLDGMNLSFPEIIETTKSDKKMDSGVIKFYFVKTNWRSLCRSYSYGNGNDKRTGVAEEWKRNSRRQYEK